MEALLAFITNFGNALQQSSFFLHPFVSVIHTFFVVSFISWHDVCHNFCNMLYCVCIFILQKVKEKTKQPPSMYKNNIVNRTAQSISLQFHPIDICQSKRPTPQHYWKSWVHALLLQPFLVIQIHSDFHLNILSWV